MTTLSTKDMSSVRKEVKVNQILHHGPRNQYYQTLNHCDCKCQDGSWKPAITYMPVERICNGSYVPPLAPVKIYVRLIEMFDDDWAVIG